MRRVPQHPSSGSVMMDSTCWRMRATALRNATMEVPLLVWISFAIRRRKAAKEQVHRRNPVKTLDESSHTDRRKELLIPDQYYTFRDKLQECSKISKECGLAISSKWKQLSAKSSSTKRTANPSTLLLILSARRQESLKTRKPIECSPLTLSSPHKQSGPHLVLFSKKGGTLRLCVNYRKLKVVMIWDSYPIPRMHKCIGFLGDKTIF